MGKNILFVCIHNSARSQMAEAFLNELGHKRFAAFSAGLEPGRLNPLVVRVMQEEGIDITQNKTKSISQFLNSPRTLDYVITVCDEASAERCPVFPGKVKRLHWGFPDPAAFQGTEQEKLTQTRRVRDQIKLKIQEWLKSFKEAR